MLIYCWKVFAVASAVNTIKLFDIRSYDKVIFQPSAYAIIVSEGASVHS